MQEDILCEQCLYYSYDDEYECGVCSLDFDEDDMQRMMSGGRCRYFRFGDDYTIVRKQN